MAIDRDLQPCATVRVRVPAKINLFLAVRGVRDDGYHELSTVFQTVSLYDTVTAEMRGEPAACRHPAARRFMRLEFDHDGGASIPDGEDNLAVRAARRLMGEVGVGVAADGESAPVEPATTRLSVAKSIPVAAGMAGGSADAAGALAALNEAWECGMGLDELRTVAADVGADVPFCVTGGTALGTGIGTALAQVLVRGQFHWVLGITDEPLPTPAVYRTWDAYDEPSEIEPDAVFAALRTGDPEALGAALHNDLQAATFRLMPELVEKRRAMLDVGALGAIVSGSGPTLLALAEGPSAATIMARRLEGVFDRVVVVSSPVGGPEVLLDRGL